MRAAKILIGLGGCPGWSESSLGAQPYCWFCHVVAHLSFYRQINSPKTIEPRHDKTNKMTVRPAKNQISLGIRPVWSESSLCAQWVAKDPSFLHADSEDSGQTGRMPRLIWVFVGRTLTLLVLSCCGSTFMQFSLNIRWGQMSHAMRKCVFGSLRPGRTQTDLLSYRDQLESWNFGYIN